MNFDRHLRRLGMPDKPVYDLWEAAWLLNRTTQSVRNYITAGTLEAFRVGCRIGGVYRESIVKLLKGE